MNMRQFFGRILGRELHRETRASVRLSDPHVAEFFGLGGGVLGHVDPARASGTAVAHRCVQLIAEALASVPLCIYARGARGARDRAESHPLYGVLHDAPNAHLTAFEFREALVVGLLTHGNAYAWISRNGRGQVAALHLVDPRTVSVERLATGRLRYTLTGATGLGPKVLLADEMLHLRYRMRPDGCMGLSPLQLARETFGIALAQGDTAAKQAAKGFRPEGALVFPQALSREARGDSLEAMRRKVEAINDPAGNILVLDGGAEWKPLAFSSKDAEFLESRKLSNLDVCRVFGVPPSAAGITDNATYSNIGEESRALVQRCLAPMARRIEQAMNATLLTPEARKVYFIEHDLAGLLRGDLGARYAAYRVGRDGGWLSPNEIRRFENMPEIEGGDEYLSPLNMQRVGEKAAE